MNLSNEIKSLLILKGIPQKELQPVFGMASSQAVANKFARNSWSAEDLVKVVDFLGGKLIVKVDNREIEITKNHFDSRK